MLNNRNAQVLLQEGANDLMSGATVIPSLISGLRAMIQEAHRRGMVVFLGTLLPQRKGRSHAGDPAVIPLANDQIRSLAASKARRSSICAAFGGSPDPLIDVDGLHATPDGYKKIAEVLLRRSTPARGRHGACRSGGS